MEKATSEVHSRTSKLSEPDNVLIQIDSEAGTEYVSDDITDAKDLYDMVYLGCINVDRRYSTHVMPWVVRQVISENKKRKRHVQVILLFNALLVTEPVQAEEGSKLKRVMERHSFDTILKLARLRNMERYLGFLTVTIKDSASSTCHAFEAGNQAIKADFLKNLRTKILEYQASASDSPRKQSAMNIAPPRPTHRRNLSSGAILNSSHQPNTVHRFSVYYVGKVTVTQAQAPPKLVDEILRDLKRMSFEEKSRDKMTSSVDSGSDLDAENGKQPVNGLTASEYDNKLVPDSPDRRRSSSDGDQRKPETVSLLRGNGNKYHEPSLAEIQEDVRSRLVTFQISMSSLMLFNYGSKTLLVERKIRDISYCTKAEANPDHFGFVCRENNQHTLYTFQGESEQVVDNIMKGMRQAFNDALQASAHQTLCDSCPLQYLLRLCERLEETSLADQQTIVQEYVQKLTDQEYTFLMNAINGTPPTSEVDRLEVTVALLRDIFDHRQKYHKHVQRPVAGDANTIIGHGHGINTEEGRERSKSTFFEKAKKSLTNSFESLLTRRARTKTCTPLDERASPLTVETGHQVGLPAPGSKCLSPLLMPRPLMPEAFDQRPRSSTYNSCPPTPTSVAGHHKFVIPENHPLKSDSQHKSMVAEQRPIHKMPEKRTREPSKPIPIKSSQAHDIVGNRTPKRQGSWRQAIYDSITAPGLTSGTPEDAVGELVFNGKSVQDPRERARERWQKAIKEQILLIRMEKENKKLAASMVATETRRLKLSYADYTKCTADSVVLWEQLLSREAKDRIDDNLLLKAVRTGVPKVRRGDVWQLLIHQHAIRTPDCDDEAWRESKYKDLVDEPTVHQHAILIDLGRTFPSHKYFTSQLGSGQLSLFNILKAYSLLDQEVGYCQGLSFVAGLLLMHMSEEESFECFRHIMFKLDIRNQYKPDMNAVQQQLYQLSRLLHDYHPSVYEHLNKHDVTPTLYAAPWFLTLFASQYPVGFVSRVMDLLFFQGMEVIFKVALVIIGLHSDEILDCDTFESVVDYLKLELPEKVKTKGDEIISRALDMDIKQQLNLFQVEYQLLHEEMIDIRQNRERYERQESANRELSEQIDDLKDELQRANETIRHLRNALAEAQNKNKILEFKVATLESERDSKKVPLESKTNSTVSSPVSEVERILNTDKPDGACQMEKSWELVPSPTTVISQMDYCLDRVESFDDSEPISRTNSDECCNGEDRIDDVCDEGTAQLPQTVLVKDKTGAESEDSTEMLM